MKRLRWWWRCWRAGHQEWVALVDWYTGKGSYGRWHRAAQHHEQMRWHGP